MLILKSGRNWQFLLVPLFVRNRFYPMEGLKLQIRDKLSIIFVFQFVDWLSPMTAFEGAGDFVNSVTEWCTDSSKMI